MNNRQNSFWDRVPMPVLIALWLLAIIIGAIMVFLAFFNPSTPSAGSQAATQSAPAAEGAPVAAATPTVSPPPPAATAAPGADPAVQPTIPPLSDPSMEFGIQSNAITGDPAYTMRTIKDKLLLGWVKQQLRWGDFSPAPGQMDWSGFDRVVEAASAHDVRVMLSIVTAPRWSHPNLQPSDSDPNAVHGPPDDLNVLAQFVGEVVDRYKGKIHAIEVWNEQNIDAEWRATPQAVDPRRYVEMLKLAYQVIKSKDPNIIVISGALSPTGAFGGGCSPAGCDDQPYLQRMTELGFLQYSDCVGVHANGINFPPDKRHDEGYNDPTAEFRGPFDNPHPSWSFRSTLEDYYTITGRQMKLCVTEFGWPSYDGLSDTPKEGYGYGMDNTQQEQADWDVQAFRLMGDWDFVKLAFLFNLDFAQKSPDKAADRAAPWSITDLQGAERPAFRTVRRFMKEVLGIP